MVNLVSLESPFNSPYPWICLRNIQYAILANTHAASLGDVTWAPHLTNTQFVKWGYNNYVSDVWGSLLSGFIDGKYFLGRDETLRLTNEVRQTKVDKVVCYTDYGISSGMKGAIEAANESGTPVEYRKLPEDMMKDVFGESVVSTVAPVLKGLSAFGLSTYGLLRLLSRR